MNKVAEERAQRRPGMYADVGALVTISNANPGIREKRPSWNNLETWTLDPSTLEGVTVGKVGGTNRVTELQLEDCELTGI